MYCSKCGKENAGNGKFCSFCGEPLKNGGTSNGRNHSKRLVSHPEVKQPGKKKNKIVLGALAVIVLIAGVIYYFFMPKYFYGTVELMYISDAGPFVQGFQLQVKDEHIEFQRREDYNEVFEGVIDSVEKVDKDSFLYRIKITDYSVNGEKIKKKPELLIKMPRRSVKGEITGAWGYIVIWDETEENEPLFDIRSWTFKNDGKIAMETGYAIGSIRKKEQINKLEKETDNWREWYNIKGYKEGELKNCYWEKQEGKKGYYTWTGDSTGQDYEMKVLPK